ncbi:Multicopper oxidase [Pleurostoma richardsiae]|uniref:Multicopper oxidase n=1 Tax=Pleurostoma richardsiae TaxID=41990 RepID=A0AA38VBU2_9PEZI|nr:Multicopper oxidase [Pleurostoma richardsiae]
MPGVVKRPCEGVRKMGRNRIGVKTLHIVNPREDDELSEESIEMHSSRVGPHIGAGVGADEVKSMLWRFRKLAALVVMSLLGVLFLHGFLADYGDRPGPLFASSQDPHVKPPLDPSRTIGIVLHPEDHINREPRSVSLRWHISAGYRHPDGVKKRVYLVNDEFPGPTIEARPGDELVIEVQNGLSDEGVAIHWHGVPVSNEMDGAAGFTQCPIAPGESFTYRLMIPDNCTGTFWWHAHFQSQRGDGLFGGFVVHEPRHEDGRTESERHGYSQDVLVMVGDWFHRSADEVMSWYTSVRSFGNEPVPDSLLVNGWGRFDCTMAVPARPLQCSQLEEHDIQPLLSSPLATSRLRLVNVGSIAGFSARVSGATMQLITVDGGFAVTAPPADELGILYPGERADVVVHWSDEDISVSRLHISLDRENFKYSNPSLIADQSFRVFGSASNSIADQETSLNTDRNSGPMLDIATATASVVSSPTALDDAQYTVVLYIKTQKLARYNNKPMGFINHTSWTPQDRPLLSLSRAEWDKNQLIPFIPSTSKDGSAPVWVDLVLNNRDDGSHPFHLHGTSFYEHHRRED